MTAVNPPDPAYTLPGEGEWETRRVPDAIRAAALANAVELIGVVEITELRHDDDVPGLAILWARMFEAYLTGEEANQ